MQNMQLMSEKDVATLRCAELLIWSIGKGLTEEAERRRNYVPSPKVEGCYRLLEDPFELKYRKLDAAGKVVEEGVSKHLRNPLVNVVNLRGSRKQVAARAYRKIESMDDRQVIVVVDGVTYDLGRNQGEAACASFLQDVRGTNFAAGAKYAGGQREVKRAAKERRAYDGLPVAKVAEAVVDPLEEQLKRLEQKVRELMGLRK